MKHKAIRIVSGIVALGSVGLGGYVVYRSLRSMGWDGLSLLCRFAIILFLASVVIAFIGYARCHAGCKDKPFPETCAADCAARWALPVVLAALFVYFVCPVHLPSGPPT